MIMHVVARNVDTTFVQLLTIAPNAGQYSTTGARYGFGKVGYKP
jgi:hypothetical protein